MILGKSNKYFWLLLLVFCGLLTFLIYGRSLSLPFFFDDFVHYPYVEANNLLEIWLTTDQLAYYRPINFSIWRVTYEIMGAHDPFLDHGINLLIHGLNGFLVGWLAARLWGKGGNQFPVVTREGNEPDRWRAVISATLFLLFPFSYQAVPWVGSLSHITVTTLILLALATYVQMRRTRQRIWGVASLFSTLLAPFAHENGLLIMPFVVLIELTTPQASDRIRRAIQAGIVWAIPLVAYLSVWFSLPRVDSGRLFPNNLEGLLQNSAYFLQGGMYPFTGFGGWLRAQFELNDMVALSILSGFGIFVAVFIQLTHKATLRSWLPWLWIILASLPSIVFLIFDYVINGPRLLMVASVGAAWLWADVLISFGRGLTSDGRAPVWRTAISITLFLLLIIQNGFFLRERMELHQTLGDGFNQILEAVENGSELGEELIVVNFPSWFAPQKSTYALGHEGVLFWPDYVPPGIFPAVHTGEFGDLSFVRVDALRPNLNNLYYGLTGPPPDWPSLAAVPSQVFVTEYGDQDLRLVPYGQLGIRDHEAINDLAVFQTGDGERPIHLLEAGAEVVEEGVQVDLTWEADDALQNTTVFVHLLDEQGNLIGQADGEPIGGSYPFELWFEGTHVHDYRWIEAGTESPAGVLVGLYNRLSGERVLALTNDGAQWPDNSVWVEINESEP